VHAVADVVEAPTVRAGAFHRFPPMTKRPSSMLGRVSAVEQLLGALVAPAIADFSSTHICVALPIWALHRLHHAIMNGAERGAGLRSRGAGRAGLVLALSIR
jgi:hypothetical protein